jgi:arsenite oxidase small subunit
MERRDFLKITAGGVAVAVAPSLITEKLYAEDGSLFKPYEKVQLKDSNGNPLKTSALQPELNYIFNYPHAGTPALLLNLNTAPNKDVKLTSEKGETYIFKGGVGSKGTIVAYSAICPHQLTYPKPSMSMFNYVDEKGKTIAYKEGGVMVCTSHLSAFDPKDGGKLVGGPAKEGVPAIVLEVDKDDTLWAVAVVGPDKFEAFFDAFKKELKEIYGRRGAKKLTKTEAKVQELKNFTKEMIIA